MVIGLEAGSLQRAVVLLRAVLGLSGRGARLSKRRLDARQPAAVQLALLGLQLQRVALRERTESAA